MRVSVFASLVYILVLAPGLALAQESRATLGGRVLDPQGSAIAGASVDVIAEDTGVTQRARTNDRGNWIVQFLLPGAYRFVVAATGFESVNRTNIDLQVADNKTIDVTMPVGASSQTVTVTAESPLIDTTTATSGPVISREEIVEMPSVSRLPTQLADMTAGVITQNPSNNLLRSWSYAGASELKINGGAGVRSNNFLLDGFPDVKAGGQIAYSPPPDSLAEYRVMTNAYDTSIGRQAGGTLLMTTKSGTSAYHGNLYEFNQSNLLNANLFQTNLAGGEVPTIQYNEYGGTFGGPIRIPKLYDGRKRTFGFVAFNGIRNENPTFGPRSLPTELERRGDFSQSYTTQIVGNRRVRYPVQVFDPQSVNAQGARTLFPGNVIPSNRLDAVAQKILGYVPLPNRPSDGTNTNNNNFIPSSTRSNKMASLSIRGDHQWSESHRSFAVVRWNHEDEDAYNDFNSVATGGLQTRIAKNVGIDHVWTLSANKILDLRFGVIRFEDFVGDRGAGFDPTALGLPQNYVSQLRVPSFPQITGIAGDFGTGNAGNFTNTTYYTWSAGLSHVLGNHTFRYGAEYWGLQQANTNLGNQGTFGFGNEWTRRQANVGAGIGEGSTIASFILGLPSSGNTARNADGFYSQRFAGFYFQDDWRVNSRLTLNYGLRWDYETPVTERYNRLTTNFDPDVLNPTSPQVQANYAALAAANRNNQNVQALLRITPANAFAVRGAQLFAGVNGQGRGSYNPDRHEFQPRGGFAYRFAKNTVIRGGIGRFSTATFVTGGQNGFSRSTPFIATQNNFTSPYETLSNPFINGLLAPTGSSLGPLTNLGQGVSWTNQNYNRPFSLIYSLMIQQQIKSWLFEIGYSHNKSYGLGWDRIINNPDFAVWNQTRAPRFDNTGRPLDRLLWDELVPNPFFGNPNYSGGIANNRTVALNQFVRPLTYLGDQTRGSNPLGTNQYDAMLINVNKRFSRGFSLKAAFTWSKLMEETTFLGPQIALVPDHRISGSNRPIVLSIAPIWELPVGRGKALFRNMPKWVDAFVGGWQLTGQYKIQSGQPVTFGQPDTSYTNPFFWDGQNAALSRDERGLSQWFDTSHFLRFPARNTAISGYPAWTGVQNLPGYNYQPRPGDDVRNGVFNSLGNYVGTAPTRFSNIRVDNVNNLDLGIYKNFRFGERYRLQYRFETFNTLNHPVFGAPNADPASSTFGVVAPNQVNNARLVQMAMKLYF